MSQEFSHGANAYVYPTEKADRKSFPRADLFRTERVIDPESLNDFKLRYYELKIAALLFPRNFIEVVAASLGEVGQAFDYTQAKVVPAVTNLMFSKKEPVPRRHQDFSAHMTIDSRLNTKVTHLNCGNCLPHYGYHLSRLLFVRARFARAKMERAGITPPHLDASDYCVSSGKGKGLVFFEVENFDPKRAEQYIANRRHKTPNILRAEGLVKRYRALQQMSK